MDKFAKILTDLFYDNQSTCKNFNLLSKLFGFKWLAYEESAGFKFLK